MSHGCDTLPALVIVTPGLFCLTEVLLDIFDVKNPHMQYARQTFQKVSLSDWKNSFLGFMMRYPGSYVTIRWDGIFRILSLSVLRQTVTSASILM